MPLDVNILQKKIEGLKEVFENRRFGDVLVTALNTGNGLMQQRIFTQNEDIEGQSFGQYVGRKRKARLIGSENRTQNKRNKALAGLELTSYQRKRKLAGRQIAKKDLEFHGGLRRSIETVVENERSAILAFNNVESTKIAHGQEQQITNIRNGQKGYTRGTGAVKIFRLNATEKGNVISHGVELITQELRKK